MKLGLTSHADDPKVLLLVLLVELGEREELEDAVCAAKARTKVALSHLFAFKFGPCLAADTALLDVSDV